jgi:hypothetical protein
VTPAKEPGVANDVWSIAKIVALLERELHHEIHSLGYRLDILVNGRCPDR